MDITELLRLFSDDSRQRLLFLVEEAELSVQELTRITGMGQSRVSRHLGLLRRAGLIRDRKEGTWTFYRAASPRNGGARANGGDGAGDLWRLVRSTYSASATARSDRRELDRIREARRERSRRIHDRLAHRWSAIGENLEGGSRRAEEVAALAAPGLVVADLGCGAGFFTSYLAARVARVIAVDHSAAMLAEARRALPAGARVEFRHGELDALPLADAEVNAIVANMVLHHVPDYGAAAREMARVLAPGGTVVITDLLPHAEDWMRDEMGDARLGVDSDEVAAALEGAGFEGLQRLPVADRYRMKDPAGHIARLELFLLRGRRRAA